jgi:hypothetical protein
VYITQMGTGGNSALQAFQYVNTPAVALTKSWNPQVVLAGLATLLWWFSEPAQVVEVASPELRLRFAGGFGGDAEGQSTRLDLGEERGGLADDVAVELVVVLPVDDDPHPLSRVLIDLVILLARR